MTSVPSSDQPLLLEVTKGSLSAKELLLSLPLLLPTLSEFTSPLPFDTPRAPLLDPLVVVVAVVVAAVVAAVAAAVPWALAVLHSISHAPAQIPMAAAAETAVMEVCLAQVAGAAAVPLVYMPAAQVLQVH